ncbi:Plant UBX domain-containing protein 13 [Spatholobus suberectus]|nr:Plant UBX domain-containing protein 13 [Spatholobus suberectus]
MATPDAVAAFMRITGAPQFVAVQKLEEYGGNLNEAINAHFLEGDRHMYGNVVHRVSFVFMHLILSLEIENFNDITKHALRS